MTKQDLIEAMAGIIAETLQDKRVENGATFVSYLPSLLGSADKEKEVAEELIKAGYGDVSEYKAEIERLKKETSDIQKRTAKEILQTLYDECYEINDETGESMGNFVSDDDILCLAKQYGVEVNV